MVQQQQLLQTDQSSVLFNPETQTKIIYRVVYPSDIHCGAKSALPPSHGWKSSNRLPGGTTAAISVQDRGAKEKVKKARHRRTRSGRVCRPPQYMLKDYKHLETVDFEVEPSHVTGAGYTDSSGDEAQVGDDHVQSRPSGVFDVSESIPTGELNSLKPQIADACLKCIDIVNTKKIRYRSGCRLVYCQSRLRGQVQIGVPAWYQGRCKIVFLPQPLLWQ